MLRGFSCGPQRTIDVRSNLLRERWFRMQREHHWQGSRWTCRPVGCSVRKMSSRWLNRSLSGGYSPLGGSGATTLGRSVRGSVSGPDCDRSGPMPVRTRYGPAAPGRCSGTGIQPSVTRGARLRHGGASPPYLRGTWTTPQAVTDPRTELTLSGGFV